MKKLISILVAFAMMATLCVCMAFATKAPEAASADEQDAAATVGKYFKVAEGVTVPDATFTFTFTSVDSTTSEADATLNRSKTLNAKTASEMQDVGGTESNDVAGSFAIAELFEDNEGKLVFDAPGVYQFTVSETGPADATSVSQDGKTTTTEDYTNDTRTFTVRIYVKYDGDELVIDTITIADEQGNKLDPTEDPTDPNFDPDDVKGANFVNNYQKKAVVDEDDLTKDNALLEITKTVSAKEGYVAADQEYPFSITLTKADNDTTTGSTVTAYKIATNGDKTEETINVGSEDTFTLKAGETLAFGELPYGMSYSITETLEDGTVVNYANYTASVTWSDGTAAADKGENLVIETGIVDDEAQDTVDVLNTLDTSDVTPTGILINNLPYIALALVAIGGLVAYVVVRRRQDDEA